MQYCSLNAVFNAIYQCSIVVSTQYINAVSEVWSMPINTATIDTIVQHHGNELCGIEWQRSRLKIITRISQIQNAQLIRVSSAHKLNHEGICMRLDWQTDGAVWQWNGKQNGRNAAGVMADSPALIPLVGNNSRFQLIIQMQMPIFIHFMRRLITSLFAFLAIHIPIIYLQ